MNLDLQIAGRTRRVILPPELVAALQGIAAPISGPIECAIDGEMIPVDIHLLEPGVLSLLIGGQAWRCVLDEGPSGRAVLISGQRLPYTVEDPRSLRARRSHGLGADGPISIKSPMPGRVARLLAAPGDTISEQQGVLVIEAMKMQNEMKSPREGKVARIAVAEGDTVSAGQVLAVIE